MRKRILTGDRPTGKLHLGHYVGSLRNRVKLQEEYECFFIIADLHTLTTKSDPQSIGTVSQNIKDLVLDYLSVGIDPEKSTIFVQSKIPEISEFAILLSMLVSISRLERIPTLKDMIKALKIENPSYGLLGYPVIQAADILVVRANLVPVGKDQESHVELTREIARRFNGLYGEVFPETKALIGDVATLVGTDGKAKMSKSLNNCIYLSDSPETVKTKVMKMYTDPTRIHPTDPGHVKGNPVFTYHDVFNKNKKEVEELKERYKKGTVGDVEVKQKLNNALKEFLAPIREKRNQFENNSGLVEEILNKGAKKTKTEAKETLRLVKKAMGLDYY
ncbi:MAG: tryptophan--tRNA ligase [Candidatus Omnitrophica bacterium]|nr:tryptophan--tRNA ligase [Candidatus Omnitrophota bacterium]MBU1047576.1 tryptophan--tRNA ligase [Candidatus Omnitrophota bacterium]MBU1630324.1 tryptophan--tRNA ligase [Candidatus Omnitrophota bacterium]MBU1766993.1 tryptophan--tRNA ligase [Candidatus Omnitrophota bacterium]MBU1888939.1 tryptophan--tRNA ligase [Candidatus Omnitrophota bacterium]